MRFLIVVLTGIMFWSASVQAQQPQECQRLAEHKPRGDVAYQPGIDANGKRVVPADINAPDMDVQSQTVAIPLTVDLARRLQNQNIDGLELEGTLGFLEVAPSGRVTYNGRDLTPQVYAICGQ